MQASVVIVAIVLVIPRVHAACGTPRTVRDWGLHRAWRVEQDCRHPEKPAVLVEVPWRVPKETRLDPGGLRPSQTALIRAGERIALTWQNDNSAGSVEGTALTTAGAGQLIDVRNRFGAAVLHGVVRGPGWVELVPGKARK